MRIPKEVVNTDLRPDMFFISKKKTNRIGMLELTVPGEDRIDVSGELKRTKYAPLEVEGKRNGLTVRIWALGVTFRVFFCDFYRGFLEGHGSKGGKRKIASAAESDAARPSRRGAK